MAGDGPEHHPHRRAGVFATIPTMLGLLPGPYALLAWVAAGLLIIVDGMCGGNWARPCRARGILSLFARMLRTGSLGRLMGFLFIWQFMVSGPLELGSGLAVIAMFAPDLSPTFAAFNRAHSSTWVLWQEQQLTIIVGPARFFAFALGLAAIVLLCRRVTTLGRITFALWLGLLATAGWILVEGALRFQANVAFDFSGAAAHPPFDLGRKLGPAMMLAIYCYLGYYHICYVGEEVREPARVIPRAIFLSVGSPLFCSSACTSRCSA